MLNYVYGVLETHVRLAAVTTGLDPTIGYLHVAKDDRLAAVFDLTGPHRPVVDLQVLELMGRNILSPADFLCPRFVSGRRSLMHKWKD